MNAHQAGLCTANHAFDIRFIRAARLATVRDPYSKMTHPETQSRLQRRP
jgi:hypothetical protein